MAMIRVLNQYLAIMAISFVLTVVHAATANANSKYAGLVIDADTGRILYQENATRYRYPASLTKMMTLYMTFDALQKGKLRYNQRLHVSKLAAAKPASKLGLRAGSTITVRDAAMSLIVKSANDSSVVLAEALAGSEWRFSRLMTEKARELGMRNTTFRNASGLHHRKQRTTAYDMARLSVALKRDFPNHYALFNRTSFKYKGRVIRGHNRVVRTYNGADGLKTGYTRASGFNLATSASRNNMNIVAIVMGGKSAKSRDRHMKKILDRGFKSLARIKKTSTTHFASIPVPVLKQSTTNRIYAVRKNNVTYSRMQTTPYHNNATKPVPKKRNIVYSNANTIITSAMLPVLKPRLNIPDQYFANRELRSNFPPIPVYKPHPNYVLSEIDERIRKNNLIKIVSNTHYSMPGHTDLLPN